MKYICAYTFDFCGFISGAYTTLNKLLAVFLIYYIHITIVHHITKQKIKNKSKMNKTDEREKSDKLVRKL